MLQNKTFNPYEVQGMAEKLAESEWLRRLFGEQENQGTAPGRHFVVGRGNGGSSREAEPTDSVQHYNNRLNALRVQSGPPYYVHTRPNQYIRQGIFLCDTTGRPRPGSNVALYEKEEQMFLTTELLLRATFLQGHKPGLILPGSNKPQLIRPGSAEGLLMSKMRASQEIVSDNSLTESLAVLEQIKNNLHFAVIVSDLLSDNWHKRLINIGRRLELVVFHIVDPWDMELPDLGGRINVQQGDDTVRINTANPRIRASYKQIAEKQQHDIDAVMKSCQAQHHRITTTKPILDQMFKVFSQKHRQPVIA